MVAFPKKEDEVLALAAKMVYGLASHLTEFPSVDAAALSTAYNTTRTAVQNRMDADVAAKNAVESKDVKLADLIEMMKKDLRLAEIDTSSDPEKLAEIGWGPKSGPSPSIPPGSPSELKVIATTVSSVWLQWQRSKPAEGGIVRNFVVESRLVQGPDPVEWSLAASTVDNKVEITGLSPNLRMEYRVKAVNVGGESGPSNTIEVIL